MIDVKMLCLGALMGREASGYDIKKELERGSSAGLIDASFGSIYPALAKLADEGLIAARSEGGRGRGDKKIYTVTPEGRAYFLRTLTGPIPDEKYRSPFLFAMLFADALPRERVRAMIDRQIAAWEDKLTAIEETAAALPQGPGLSFVSGFADATLRAGLDHLRRHRATLEAAAMSEPPTPVRPQAAAPSQPAVAAE
jgi:DNA-binding PadR family transcriptional regulator